MALRDFKKYMLGLQAQYLEMKNDLADYDEAFKAGNITEDQLESVKEDITRIEENYKRLLYAVYLIELPKRKDKQAKFRAKNAQMESYFGFEAADDNAVFDENKSLLDNLRKELKNLTNKKESK